MKTRNEGAKGEKNEKRPERKTENQSGSDKTS
jgi:hypothetical protein